MNEIEEIFGEVISTYSRAQALEDGALVDVSDTAREAGITFPVAVTARVWGEIVTPDPRARSSGQSERGRLWDVVCMLRWAIRGSGSTSRIRYRFLAVMKAKQRRYVDLVAVCGPGDDLEPVITIMLPGED